MLALSPLLFDAMLLATLPGAISRNTGRGRGVPRRLAFDGLGTLGVFSTTDDSRNSTRKASMATYPPRPLSVLTVLTVATQPPRLGIANVPLTMSLSLSQQLTV